MVAVEMIDDGEVSDGVPKEMDPGALVDLDGEAELYQPGRDAFDGPTVDEGELDTTACVGVRVELLDELVSRAQVRGG